MAISLPWFTAKGAPWNTQQDIDYAYYSYLANKSGLGNVPLASHLDKVLTTLGYTNGDLQFRLKTFYAAKTGLSASCDFATLENKFYSNNSNDFA